MMPRQFLIRLLLILTLFGGSLGLFLYPQSVAAAGWNHFVDPYCEDSAGKAWPGINWWGYGFWDDAAIYSQMYYWTGAAYTLNYTSSTNYQRGSSGDIRRFAASYQGTPRWYKGEVVYTTSFADNGSYAEEFHCW